MVQFQTPFSQQCERTESYHNAVTAYLQAKAAYLELQRVKTLLRPSILLEAGLEEIVDEDGNARFVAFIGEVYADAADTPDEAFANFDRAWMLGRDNN